MKKTLVTHVVVMVVAVICGAFLASSLTVQRANIVKVEGQLSKAPLGGFNKFTSDVQWMLFINYCGGLESVNDSNVKEVAKRLDAIIANDPNHQAAYELGGMMFSVRDPQKAVEVFTNGANNPNFKNNWKLPYWAGFVLTQHVTDKDDSERLKKAEAMYRLALSRNSADAMPAIFSALLRTRAKRIAKRKTWKGIPIVNAKHAYLCAMFDEWRKSDGVGVDDQGGEVFSGASSSAGSTDFRAKLLVAAQQAKASAPANKNVLKSIDKVLQKVLKDDHLCSKCLAAYAPGDKFCSSCGVTVAVYGVCPKCKTVMKNKYCSSCGHTKK